MIDEARKTMKRCQVGVPRRNNAYEELHDILADCYGTIGRLVNEVEALRAGAKVPEGDVAWLHKFINCTPFGADAPQSDIRRAHDIVAMLAAAPSAKGEG